MGNYWIAIIYFFIAYIIVSLLILAHLMFNIKVLKIKTTPRDEETNLGEAYRKTIIFQPFYAAILFPIFAGMYLRTLGTLTDEELPAVMLVSLLWGVLTIILDALSRVVIKHPWAMSARDFYVNHQPWLVLTYIIIFASPFLAFTLMK